MSEETTQHEPQPDSPPTSDIDAAHRTIEQLQKQLEEVQRVADTHKDQLLRKAAEFENFKRRSESEFANVIKNANEGLIAALLPIISDFVRSLKAGADKRDYEALYKGIELIYTKMMKTLESRGLQSFDSVGKPFDVEYHDALLQVPSTDVPPHTVIEEVERGYTLNDRVLRHAKVIVSAAPAEPADADVKDDAEEARAN
jgi:molecular chaperone GrpE